MYKIYEELKVLNLFSSTTVTADVATTTGVSVEAYEDDALVIVQIGSVASTAATFAINVTASTVVGGVYSDIGTITTFTESGEDKIASIPVSLVGDNKFLKLDIDTTANAGTISAIIGAVIVVRPTIAEADINSATPA